MSDYPRLLGGCTLTSTPVCVTYQGVLQWRY